MDFNFSDEQIALQQSCNDFAKNEIAPYAIQLEQDLEFRKGLFVRMAKMGFYSLLIPSHKPHHLNGMLSYVLALKEIAKWDAGVAVSMAVSNMVAEAIELYGTLEEKKRFLHKITNGECVPLAFALTEKNAGSDAKNLSTLAKHDPEDRNTFILNGEKQFITNGDLAGLLVVMAQTEQGITAFLLDGKAHGLKVIKKEQKLGLLSVSLCDLKLENCRVPKAHILGLIGDGLKIALATLDSGRIGIAAQSLGIAEAAFEAALHYAKERKQFGHPIADFQSIAFKLADMQTKIQAGNLLLYKAAWLKEEGKPYTLEASTAKLFCSEMCNEVATEALQIHGGYGYTKDYPVEKYFRDARVTTLYEGTSEIQRIVISRALTS